VEKSPGVVEVATPTKQPRMEESRSPTGAITESGAQGSEIESVMLEGVITVLLS
jgi:hypothetical protein